MVGQCQTETWSCGGEFPNSGTGDNSRIAGQVIMSAFGGDTGYEIRKDFSRRIQSPPLVERDEIKKREANSSFP